MYPAKSRLIRLIPDVTFHIRRTVSQHKIQRVLLQFPFNKTERTLVTGIYRIMDIASKEILEEALNSYTPFLSCHP